MFWFPPNSCCRDLLLCLSFCEALPSNMWHTRAKHTTHMLYTHTHTHSRENTDRDSVCTPEDEWPGTVGTRPGSSKQTVAAVSVFSGSPRLLPCSRKHGCSLFASFVFQRLPVMPGVYPQMSSLQNIIKEFFSTFYLPSSRVQQYKSSPP